MSLLGLAFLLYLFKLSTGNGFWNNLQIADKKLYQPSIKVERLSLTLKRYECNLKFLMKCRDTGVYPKFARYKNLKSKPYKIKNRYYRRILLDEITTKNRSILNFRKQLYETETALHESTTWLNRLSVTYTLSNVANREARKLKTFMEKKFSKILKYAEDFDGIYPSPNVTIANLSSRLLTNDEYETL